MKTTTWMAVVIAGATVALVAPATHVAAATASAAAGKTAAQKSFATPQEGAKALVDAVRAGRANDILALIGPSSKSWLLSGDKVSDRAEWKRFLDAYDRKNSIRMEGDSKAVLEAGDGDWSFPAPLVKRGDRWVFDAEAGREEVLNRRVGHNELDTVQTLLAIVDAQREYAVADPEHKGMSVYAAKFRSSPGKKDGLYWPTKAGEPQSPLGPLVAQAVREGYGAGGAKTTGPVAYHGYYYRILTSQGKDAPGGAFNYVVNGKLFGGFAVVAWPASYGNSGVKSFLVNHEGIVYEKDLGADSAAAATKIKAFDPSDWKKVP
jgi:hypothetical protein